MNDDRNENEREHSDNAERPLNGEYTSGSYDSRGNGYNRNDRYGNQFGQYSNNGGQYSGFGGYSDEQRNNGNHNQSGRAFTVLMCALVCVLICSVFFLVSRGFVQNGDPDDGNGITENGTSQTQTPASSENNSALQEGNFTLETVTAEEHYKLASVYQLTKDTVVEITTESVQTGSFMQQYVTTGAGSGVIISEDGYIVTNNHVIDGATKITIALTNGDKYDATVVGADSKTDLAVLKIEATGLKKAAIGVSGDLLVGEQILVIGNPLGSLGGSAASGIVSATARQISVEGQLMTLIQTDTAVNPGNSGGAMFNMSGQLVGIVNAKYTDEAVEGIGFAIPIDSAKPIIEDLTNWGYVKGRPNLGLTIEYGTSKYISSVGATNWVTAVTEGSDAGNAGLKVMDQVVSVNGVSFTSAEALNAYLDTLKVGDTVTFVVKRYTAVSSSFWGTQYSSEELTFRITLSEYVK